MATTTQDAKIATAYDRFADHLAAVDVGPNIVKGVRQYADKVRPTAARKDAKLAIPPREGAFITWNGRRG